MWKQRSFRRLIAGCAVIGLAMATLVVFGTSRVSAGPPGGCTVRIIREAGSDNPMNVGEQATFGAQVSGVVSPLSYQWTVSGDILKDYTDYTQSPSSASNYVDGFAPIPMTASDFRNQTIQFYWGPDPSQISPLNGGPVTRTISVSVPSLGVPVCSSQMTVSVERNNTDPARDAEHWYTSNHDGRVLNEHGTWHMHNPDNTAAYDGHQFFEFHHLYIATFNSWRQRFGYPPVGPAYNPATPIPSGVDIDHAGRTTPSGQIPNCAPFGLPSCATPSEFTTTGTTPHTTNFLPCDPAVAPANEPKRIQDFPANQKLLGCAVTSPWHNTVHGAIGGDMGSIWTSPADPLFWRWHKFVDQISLLRSTFPGSPIIQSESPARFYPWITSLPQVEIRFDKPVRGVSASDLTVNERPAKKVTGSGAGPYIFTGFATPKLGTIKVALTPGSITAAKEYRALADTWTYDRLNANALVPGDTLTVGQKIAMSLNPTLASQMSDGIPDGFKLANSCIADLIFVNINHPVDYDLHPLPPISNPDSQTINNAYHSGTSPCVSGPTGGSGPVGLVNDTHPLTTSAGRPDSGIRDSLIILLFVAIAIVLPLSWDNRRRRDLRVHNPIAAHNRG
jgi:hypothetical protein